MTTDTTSKLRALALDAANAPGCVILAILNAGSGLFAVQAMEVTGTEEDVGPCPTNPPAAVQPGRFLG